jgi:hypothetical protein
LAEADTPTWRRRIFQGRPKRDGRIWGHVIGSVIRQRHLNAKQRTVATAGEELHWVDLSGPQTGAVAPKPSSAGGGNLIEIR